VSNCGNVTLTNIIVTDTLYGQVATFASLAPGASQPYSKTVTNSTCGTYPNTVNASGSSVCGGGQVQASANATCIVNCKPLICVIKEVACFLGQGAPGADQNGCGAYSKFAIGVQGTHADGSVQEPAFCYRITVTNCGTVALTNVTVSDDKYPSVSAADFGTCLAGVFPPGGTCSFEFKAQAGTTDTIASTLTNTVTACGNSQLTGEQTCASDHAAIEVVPAKVSCEKFYTIDGGPPTSNNTGNCIQDANPHTVVWSVTITNTGLANLLDLTVTDVSTDPNCNVSFSLRELAAGGSITFPICTNAAFMCGQGVEDTITVVANSFTYTTNETPLCEHDINGTNITASTTCTATLCCTAPAICRVTGGGRQDLNDPNGSVCPTDVRYVTHGGQVGAPVGNRVCSIDTSLPNYFLGNPCIHGRWTHVRHVQGGLEGNFHARFFDTLDCACLETNFDATTCQYPLATVTDGVCGNRNIGPLPRKAPANKIVFTGVGDWACPNGHREGRSCLFRVDIEDRGEPGNAHALAADKKPGRVPDRYRIRIWVLDDNELAQLNSGGGADPYLLSFRNAISACNGIDYRDGGIIGQCGAPNTCASNDSCTRGGTGSIMFPNENGLSIPVRLPNIDDGGEMLHGNHQIHPQIKSCDPANPTGPGLAKP
jgi:hypothetical protein